MYSSIGTERKHSDGSYSNQEEAVAVASLVLHALLYVPAASIGVICLYRQQARTVASLLSKSAAQIMRQPVPVAVQRVVQRLAATTAKAAHTVAAAKHRDEPLAGSPACASASSSSPTAPSSETSSSLALLGNIAHRAASVKVSTVDAFQGEERDVIVLSCVRSGSGAGGFLASPQRLCVAMTRAKRHLLVCGDGFQKVPLDDLRPLDYGLA